MGPARQALGGHLDGEDEIQPDKGEVSQVLSGQALGFQMGVDKPQTPTVARAEAVLRQVGNEDAFSVANKDEIDDTAAVDEKAELPLYLPGEGGKLPGCFRRDDLLRPRFCAGQLLEAANLAGF